MTFTKVQLIKWAKEHQALAQIAVDGCPDDMPAAPQQEA